ncbi:large conductance mechanosensitive channel protein MscL [Brevibacillus fluminis]|uniref:Large-conductance mechanosensitive channel n=1 Tax=Brevibacillus fluminis TaxID=511487 RepID=A0A3M8DDA1_9BACL|nr:large conductance mechanosensitive channel protein MscL [Brevibacillus fluminis]RNB85978.1 large conductance mechanosensitive channel protein MscL [Brevibacillus fluminis]
MWNEFKKFAMKGNVLDLAIGVIIGGAFGKIVSSLVNDVMVPILGLLMGGLDLTRLALTVDKASIKYGAFFQSVIDFLIVSFSIFLFVKALNHFKRKTEEKPAEAPAPSKEELLLTEIRDLLKQQNQRETQ